MIVDRSSPRSTNETQSVVRFPAPRMTLWLTAFGIAALHVGAVLWSAHQHLSFLAALMLAPAIIFWSYGWVAALGALCSCWCGRQLREMANALADPNPWPPVAVFYLCCDDFQADALQTLLASDYPALHVFVLDDSETPDQRSTIRELCSRHPGRITYHSRGIRIGAKAGNINSGLAMLPEHFEAVLICDADERIKEHTLRGMVRWLAAHERIAFVQSTHIANPARGTPYARSLAFTVSAFWRFCIPWRQWYGMPVCLGHGVLIRRRALEEVGRFPETSSEDIILTFRLRLRGWHGVVFCPSDPPEEDVPATVQQYRQRLFRWTKQDARTVWQYSLPILRSSSFSAAEKIDWMYRNLKFPLAALVFPYLLLLGMIRVIDPDINETTSSWNMSSFATCALVGGLAPFLVYLFDCGLRPVRFAAVVATIVSNSLMLVGIYIKAVLSWVGWREVAFVPTGRRSVSRYDRVGSMTVELLATAALVAVGTWSSEWTVAAIGLVIALGPTCDLLGKEAFTVIRWIGGGVVAIALVGMLMSPLSPVISLLAISVFAMLVP